MGVGAKRRRIIREEDDEWGRGERRRKVVRGGGKRFGVGKEEAVRLRREEEEANVAIVGWSCWCLVVLWFDWAKAEYDQAEVWTTIGSPLKNY